MRQVVESGCPPDDLPRREVGERFERARRERKEMEARLIDAIAGRPAGP